MRKRTARPAPLLAKSRVRRIVRDHTNPQAGDFATTLSKKGARICVVRGVGGIGDILMTTPALMELKRSYPHIHLTYAVDRHRTTTDAYYELVKNAPFIDEVKDARYIRPADYDAHIDISAVCIKYERKALPVVNRIDLFARHLNVPHLRQKIPFYRIEPDEELWARAFLNRKVPEGHFLVALHTASFEAKRSWPIEKYQELTAAAQGLPITFLVFDFNRLWGNLKTQSNCIDASNTSVRQMAALIDKCDLFVGPDSGPMHIAGALRKRSLVVFGSIPPHARINYYPSHTAIRLEHLDCLGCWYVDCPYNVKCMRHLDSMMVLSRVIQALEIDDGEEIQESIPGSQQGYSKEEGG